MISGDHFYDVLSAVVPLYAAMILAYGSVRWWGVLTPDQCAGISRYVAVFALPVLIYNVIASTNLLKLDYKFIAADSLQKVVTMIVLVILSYLSSVKKVAGGHPSPEWSISIFAISSLPNTLVVGIPFLKAMYGDHAATLMAQVIVLQAVVWTNVLLLLYEFRAAKSLINGRFRGSVREITSVAVDSDVISLNGMETLETDAEMDNEGKLHVRVRRSPYDSTSNDLSRLSSMRTMSLPVSNLRGVDIYPVQSSLSRSISSYSYATRDSTPGLPMNFMFMSRGSSLGLPGRSVRRWEFDVMPYGGAAGAGNHQESSNVLASSQPMPLPDYTKFSGSSGSNGDFTSHNSSPQFVPTFRLETFRSKAKNCLIEKWEERSHHEGSRRESRNTIIGGADGQPENGDLQPPETQQELPPTTVMAKLMLLVVWRKFIRNPLIYACLLGIAWSIISNKCHVKMPAIIQGCISIFQNTGLGMTMFSLGLFTALQPKIIACGKGEGLLSMVAKFLLAPAVMAVTSLAVGIRGETLHIAIVQAALPVGMFPFVLAKEYDLHAVIMSTSVIFGIIIALPVVIVYNILLEL